MARHHKKHKEHAALGPSSAARWMACPPSVLASAGKRRESSAAADEGTLAHEVLEACLMLDLSADGIMEYVEHAGVEISEEMRRCVAHAATYVHRWEADHPNGIVVLEHRVDPGQLLGREDMYGTADILLIDVDAGSMESVDYKHGKKRVSAVNNPQVKLYGIGGLIDFFPQKARRKVKVKLVIIQPRVSDWESEEDVLGADLLDWLEKEVRPAAEATADVNGPRLAGKHCFFCRAAGTCREQTQKAFAIAAMEFEVLSLEEQVPIDIDELDSEEIGYALKQIPFLLAWAEALQREALRLLLDGHEIPGQQVVYKKKHRRWDVPKLMQTLLRRKMDLDTYAPRSPLGIGDTFKQLKRDKAPPKVVEAFQAFVQDPDPEVAIAPLGDDRTPVDRESYGYFKENLK